MAKKALVDALDILSWMNDQNPAQHLTVMEELELDVVDQLERDLRRNLREETKEMIFDSKDTAFLVLPQRLTSVTNPVPAFESRFDISEAWEVEEAGIYEYEDIESGQTTVVTRTDGNRWYCGNNVTKVTGRVGYKSNDLPGDLRRLIMELCASSFRDRVRVSGRIGVDDTTQDSPLTASSKRTLAAWKAPEIELTRQSVVRLTRI